MEEDELSEMNVDEEVTAEDEEGEVEAASGDEEEEEETDEIEVEVEEDEDEDNESSGEDGKLVDRLMSCTSRLTMYCSRLVNCNEEQPPASPP